MGGRILYQALEAPARGILTNATPNWSEIYQDVLRGKEQDNIQRCSRGC